jgi:hypothetical protein
MLLLLLLLLPNIRIRIGPKLAVYNATIVQSWPGSMHQVCNPPINHDITIVHKKPTMV